jgi:hypothetical protein
MTHAAGHDDAPDPDGCTDSVWLTKAQLAAVRKISLASAGRLVRRQGWQEEPGENGRARVLVPRAWAQPRKPYPAGRVPGGPTDRSVQFGNDPADIRKELAILTAAHNRADRAEAEARAAQSRAMAAEALAAIAQARADAAEATVQELRQAIRARDAAEQAGRPEGLLKKLTTALRGITTAPSR